MEFDVYQVDAFADRVFAGNPAAVVPLRAWLDDATLQQMAAEHNLSETAFFVPTEKVDCFHLRWFTPSVEVDLCGHATLASGFVVLNYLSDLDVVHFETRSGRLSVSRESDGGYRMDLPMASVLPIAAPEGLPGGLVESLGAAPLETLMGDGMLLCSFESQNAVAALKPDFATLRGVDAFGVIATAPADDADLDFVSRFFGPAAGVDEDPVTGAAHTRLAPYWANRLGKTVMTAKQISARRGLLRVEVSGPRVALIGQAVLYMTGRVYLS